MTPRHACWIGALALFTACAPTLPAKYLTSRAAAERAYSSGRYSEAAQHWLDAARATDRPRDAEEARFRAAASLQRAGASARAERLYAEVAAERPRGERAARAEYERIRLERAAGRSEQARRDLELFLRRFPESGLAPAALDECLRWYRDHATADATLAWLDAEIRASGDNDLAEALGYRRARLLDAHGETQRARDAYLALAARFPYPRGAYWDDALWYASLADEQLGRYSAAIADLERMLAEKETAYLQGSYERPRYDDAQFRIAELYRDRLGDPVAAQRAFDRVFSEHPTSRLRDDALWNEALLALHGRDRAAACRTLRRLADALPESRYAACAPLACGEPAKSGATCHDYLRRELERAREGR